MNIVIFLWKFEDIGVFSMIDVTKECDQIPVDDAPSVLLSKRSFSGNIASLLWVKVRGIQFPILLWDLKFSLAV